MADIKKSDAEWQAQLTPEQYRVTRQAGTERPFTGAYWDTFTPGRYHCICCDAPLFVNSHKFDAGCGWPSFSEVMESANVTRHEDNSHGMVRVEVRCGNCDAHLGHVFPDGPTETGLRYCINSVSMKFYPDDAS